MSKVLPLLTALLLAVPSLYVDEAEDKAVEAVMKLGGTDHVEDSADAGPRT
jgi:hypothetical protein